MTLLLFFPGTDDVFLHTGEVVVDCIRGRGGRRRAVHAPAQLVLDGGASAGVEAGRGPAGYFPPG